MRGWNCLLLSSPTSLSISYFHTHNMPQNKRCRMKRKDFFSFITEQQLGSWACPLFCSLEITYRLYFCFNLAEIVTVSSPIMYTLLLFWKCYMCYINIYGTVLSIVVEETPWGRFSAPVFSCICWEEVGRQGILSNLLRSTNGSSRDVLQQSFLILFQGRYRSQKRVCKKFGETMMDLRKLYKGESLTFGSGDVTVRFKKHKGSVIY